MAMAVAVASAMTTVTVTVTARLRETRSPSGRPVATLQALGSAILVVVVFGRHHQVRERA